MQVQIDIPFEQLIEIAKKLPKSDWQKMKTEVESNTPDPKTKEEFRKFLLNGPTLTKEEIQAIEESRKAINKWRKI